MKNARLFTLMRWADHVLTACFVLSVFIIALFHAKASLLLIVKLLILTALPFLLVTLLRHFFAKKRPYQSSDESPPRKGINDSFPSRHAFSAFLIAMVAFSIGSLWGYTLLPLAVALSALRVFRGIHYPIDVIVGGFLGVFFGTIFLIII